MQFIVSSEIQGDSVLDVSGSDDPAADRLREWELLRDASSLARHLSLDHPGQWTVSNGSSGHVPVATWSNGSKTSQFFSQAELSPDYYFARHSRRPDRTEEAAWKLTARDAGRTVSLDYKGALDDLDTELLTVVWPGVRVWYVAP
jgi:hypothetical protein